MLNDPIYDVRSILLYYGLFCVSILFFATSDDLRSRGRERGGKLKLSGLLSGLAILLICLVAAFRADSVGVDTSLYPDLYLNCARSHTSFLACMADTTANLGAEPLNGILVWVCSRISSGKWLLLFSYQFFTVVPTYFALQKLKDRFSPAMGMAVYLFVFYNNSLNMMRQSISCAFLLLAFAWLISNKRLSFRFALYCLVAALFHKSGLLGVFMILALSFVGTGKAGFKKYLVYALIILLPVFSSVLVTSLITMGFNNKMLVDYADIFIFQTTEKDWYINPLGTYSIRYLLLYGMLLLASKVLPYLKDKPILHDEGSRNEASNKALVRYLWDLNCSGYLIYTTILFYFQTVYGGRFSLYLDYFFVFSLPLACRKDDKSKRFALFLILSVYWLVWIPIMGWSGSTPYLFCFEA